MALAGALMDSGVISAADRQYHHLEVQLQDANQGRA